MIVSLNQHGSCLSDTCAFRSECAQHESAGHFRSEDGFTPEIYSINGRVICETADKPTDKENESYPEEWESLKYGFTRVYEKKPQNELLVEQFLKVCSQKDDLLRSAWTLLVNIGRIPNKHIVLISAERMLIAMIKKGGGWDMGQFALQKAEYLETQK